MSEILGIDVGGTGTKGALVNITKGRLVTERIKYPTPRPATPENIVEVIKKIVSDHNWKGKPIGVGFPAIIKNGICHSASNIDKDWLDFPIEGFLNKKLKSPVTVTNDADAAGIAEIHFGDDKNKHTGTTLFLTLGTGIGSALFYKKQLVPNIELGHLRYKDGIAEQFASNYARESGDLSWKTWGKELNHVLKYIEFIFSPDLILLGGGISKKFEKYKEYIKCEVKVKPATLLNNAGIVGAAMAAKQDER